MPKKFSGLSRNGPLVLVLCAAGTGKLAFSVRVLMAVVFGGLEVLPSITGLWGLVNGLNATVALTPALCLSGASVGFRNCLFLVTVLLPDCTT